MGACGGLMGTRSSCSRSEVAMATDSCQLLRFSNWHIPHSSPHTSPQSPQVFDSRVGRWRSGPALPSKRDAHNVRDEARSILISFSLSGGMFGAVTLGRNILVVGGCQGATNTKVNTAGRATFGMSCATVCSLVERSCRCVGGRTSELLFPPPAARRH